jgi:hypothetical protein
MDRFARFIPVIVTAALLALLASYNFATRVSAADADPYHARVREAVAGVPMRINDWNGRDETVPREAQALLRPNAIFSRRYVNAGTNDSVALLLVQCRDIRDMLGHYPPVCYPANGKTLERETPTELHVGGSAIPAVVYEFSYNQGGEQLRLVVINFLVLPDGRYIPDMAALRRAAGYRRRQPYGAAQVQLVLGGEVPMAHREQIVSDLVGGVLPVLDVIRGGGVP